MRAPPVKSQFLRTDKTVSDFRKQFKGDTKREFTVKKIWVCGPPIMSDNFDRDL